MKTRRNSRLGSWMRNDSNPSRTTIAYRLDKLKQKHIKAMNSNPRKEHPASGNFETI